MLLRTAAVNTYEELCSLDVLGLSDTHHQSKPDDLILEKFRSQLTQDKNGCYETNLIWKKGQSKLKNNKAGSLDRLKNLVGNIQQEKFKAYDDIIKAQIENGIVERAPLTPDANKEFYLPRKPVFREGRETTKLRVVYDASAKSSRESPSLNKCLEKRPPSQNLLWNILVRNRFKPYAITADIQKAFLQIRILEFNRDALRFQWIKNQDINQVDILRFTRLVFGLTQSPFVLEATLGEHILKYRKAHEKIVEKIAASMYVDDLTLERRSNRT